MIYFFDVEAEFTIIIPVSHDTSEIILICRFGAKEKILIVINEENGCFTIFENVVKKKIIRFLG